jgi:hypothetical protein
MNIDNTFLKYLSVNGVILVPLWDVLQNGDPMEKDSDEVMTLFSIDLFDKDGKKI